MTENSINFHGHPLKVQVSCNPGQLYFEINDDEGVCNLNLGQVRELRIFLAKVEPELQKNSQRAKFKELINELGPETLRWLIKEWETR